MTFAAWDKLTIEKWLASNDVGDAKEFFMRFMPVKNISDITGVPVDVLRTLCAPTGEWTVERAQYSEELREGVKQETLSQLKKIARVGLSLIEAGLGATYKRFQELQVAPTLEETAMITGIVKSLHAAKMDEEKGSGRDLVQSLSPQEIMVTFREDPYLLPSLLAQNIHTFEPPKKKGKGKKKALEITDGEIRDSEDSGDIFGPEIRETGGAPSGDK